MPFIVIQPADQTPQFAAPAGERLPKNPSVEESREGHAPERGNSEDLGKGKKTRRNLEEPAHVILLLVGNQEQGHFSDIVSTIQ
jgi:hypothetical protein